MKISVVMATYNGERYIKEQLMSIAAQSHRPDEVIICDDCSTDGTVATIGAFLSENNTTNWHLFVNETRLGYKKNFFEALGKSTGDLVFLCDQDDRWQKNKIARMADFFDIVPDVLVLASSFSLIDGMGETIDDCAEINTANHGLISFPVEAGTACPLTLSTVLHSNVSPGCTLALARRTVDDFCKTSKSNISHDLELCLYAAKNSGLYFLNERLSEYRLHENNVLGFRGEKSSRTEIAMQKAEAVMELSRYGGEKELLAFYRKRADALDTHRFFGVLSLLFDPLYHRYFSVREQLGDLFFTLRK